MHVVLPMSSETSHTILKATIFYCDLSENHFLKKNVSSSRGIGLEITAHSM